MQRLEPWHGHCQLTFQRSGDHTRHQGGCSAPLKMLRAEKGENGRCELPLLHTAGGLVGGDQLSIELTLEPNSRGLVTSVAAQKIYGSVGRSQLEPRGRWACQHVRCHLDKQSDLEWLPQELVVFADGLYEQHFMVQLHADASFLGTEIVRLGRTASGESLQQGQWRSNLSIQRCNRNNGRPEDWELVDRIELGGDAVNDLHGLNGKPVFGSLVWAAPMNLEESRISNLLSDVRSDREGLSGTMSCSALHQGLVARYVGTSSRDARFWFSRIWARTRALRKLQAPRIPRVWPLQEAPLQR